MKRVCFFILALAVSLLSAIRSPDVQAASLLTRIATDDSSFAGEFHPTKSNLYLARTAKSIKLINIENGKELWTQSGDGYGTRILPILFDRTGDRIFVADLRGNFRVLSSLTGDKIASFSMTARGAINFASVLAISVDGTLLYAVDREVVYEFSLDDYSLKRRFVTPYAANEVMGMFVTATEIKTLDNNRLTTWSLADPATEPQPSSRARLNASIVVGYADRTSASLDHTLIFLNEENSLSLIDFNGVKVRNCTGFIGFPWSSRPLGGEKILSVHRESTLKVWNLSTCAVTEEIALTDSFSNDIFPFSVRVSADESYIAVTSGALLIFFKL
jgi:WD40 repeat protein